MKKLTLIIPAKNESESLPKVLHGALQQYQQRTTRIVDGKLPNHGKK